MNMILSPKGFLQVGGVVLVLVGLLGFFGPIGPTAEDSIFGSFWWFDNGENWAHTVLGIVALLAAFLLPAGLQRPLVMLVGLLGLFFAVYNVFSATFLGANLESPADLVLHLVVGLWALWASKKKGAMMPAGPSMGGGMGMPR